MSESNKTDGARGASADDSVNQGVDDGDSKQTVAFETHRKLLSEKKTLSEKLKTLEDELGKYRQADKDREAEDAKKRGDFEKLLKLKDEELTTVKGQLQNFTQQEMDRKRLAAIVNKVDIPSKFYRFVDFEDVVVNPTTGEVDETSVAKVVERIKTQYPEIIRRKDGPQFPNHAPAGGHGGGLIPLSEYNKMKREDQAKLRRDQIDFNK